MLRTIVGIAVGAAFLFGSATFATPAIQKKEKKPCTTCHPSAKSKDLNETGKYYKEKKTLEGAPAAK